MNNKIKVSIVTPSYNQGQFIEETILSVLNQSYKNIEYIIVDGGSIDNTMEVVEKYRDKIDIIIHEKDKGQSDAINKGFKLATGELVGWLNSDDILYPECVEKIVELYKEKPGGSIYYNSVIDIIDSKGTLLKKYSNIIPDKSFLLNTCYSVCQQGSFYPHKILKKINYVDQTIHYCMDLDLWLRLLEHGHIYAIDNKSYAALREWETAKTATGGNRFLLEIRKTLLNYGANSWSKSVRRTYWYQFKTSIKNFISPALN